MIRNRYSSPTIDSVIVVIIVVTTLSHSYASIICISFGCDASTLLSVKAVMLVGMVAAGGALLFRAFKYRSIDRSTRRGEVTFTVVLVASSHTIAHNICHAFVDGTCGPTPAALTALFLMLASFILCVNPKELWTMGVNDAVEGPKTTGRTFIRTMINNRYFIWLYWTYVVLIIWVVWESGVASEFFEPEILASLLVGLIGLFIALLFANHERNKRITENHFYKTNILWHIDPVLRIVALHFRQQQTGGSNESDGGLGENKGDGMVRDPLASEYKYHRGRIEALNANTYVPADIRTIVFRLMQAVDNTLVQYRPARIFDNPDADMRQMLKVFDLLEGYEYFTTDRDPSVREMWGRVKLGMDDVRMEVDKFIRQDTMSKK